MHLEFWGRAVLWGKPANIAISFLWLFTVGGEEREQRSTFLEALFQSGVIWTQRIKSSTDIDWHKSIAFKYCTCIRSCPELLSSHQKTFLVTSSITMTHSFHTREAKTDTELLKISFKWPASLGSLKTQGISSVLLLSLPDWAAVQFKSWVKFYNHAIKLLRKTFCSLNRKQSRVWFGCFS